jgi:predicted ATPase
MHLNKITLFTQNFPTREHYPFNLATFQQTRSLGFDTPVTFFVGENGSGKSTLLKAIAHACQIHIWRDAERPCYESNPYREALYKFMQVHWTAGRVSGAYFDSELSRTFAQNLDEWAISDPGIFQYFGGKSLMTQSHGQSLMSYFGSRYRIKGLYLLDEPETALSPQSQLTLLKIFKRMSRAGHAQFIVATHSPILMACPGAAIYNFDALPLAHIPYEKTQHFKIYKRFFADQAPFIED